MPVYATVANRFISICVHKYNLKSTLIFICIALACIENLKHYSHFVNLPNIPLYNTVTHLSRLEQIQVVCKMHDKPRIKRTAWTI